MASLHGLPQLPLTHPALQRNPTVVLPDLHPHALLPGRPRHPQEADLTAGHGILRYTGLITITATTIEDLDTHVAALEQAAIQANCETRLLAGQ